MKSLVLAGGELKVTKELTALAKTAELVVAADSGLKHAKALKVKPTVIIGDFDSIASKTLADYPEIERITYPRKKDYLDFELALQYVQTQGSKDILVFGATGGRLDQSLAAIMIAAKTANKSNISLHSGKQDLYFMAGSSLLGLELKPGTTFSIISFSKASKLSLKGAEYELEKAELSFAIGKGVSNVSVSPTLTIKLFSGLIVIIVEKEL